jgi:hypothetical protein
LAQLRKQVTKELVTELGGRPLKIRSQSGPIEGMSGGHARKRGGKNRSTLQANRKDGCLFKRHCNSSSEARNGIMSKEGLSQDPNTVTKVQTEFSDK